jgi:predicted HTH domain antitoxin
MPVKVLNFKRDEVVKFFQEEFHDEASETMAEAAVMDLVRRGIISSGKAAELLGVSRWDMPDLMNKHKVPAFELLPGETMEDHLAHGREVFKRLRKE